MTIKGDIRLELAAALYLFIRILPSVSALLLFPTAVFLLHCRLPFVPTTLPSTLLMDSTCSYIKAVQTERKYERTNEIGLLLYLRTSPRTKKKRSDLINTLGKLNYSDRSVYIHGNIRSISLQNRPKRFQRRIDRNFLADLKKFSEHLT